MFCAPNIYLKRLFAFVTFPVTINDISNSIHIISDTSNDNNQLLYTISTYAY